MTASFIDALQTKPVIPLIEAGTATTALAAAGALQSAGITVVEVVQRNAAALECLEAIADELPDLVVGAGTVLTADQAIACIDAGADFIVSPGLDEAVVRAASSRGRGILPGIMTPTELQHALRLDLEAVKFFPASTAGGAAAVSALAAAFRTTRFVPTGGISAATLADYLALDAVLACGGSWMTPGDAVARGDLARIRSLASEALEIAAAARRS